MQLALSTWIEVERYLQRSTGVIVPLGSIEQHGPNGLIGTDALCAEAVAAGVGERYDVLIAPVIAYGVAQFNLSFPGTLSVRSTTLMALIHDVVGALARHGFKRIYFLNGHGGNIAPMHAALQDIYGSYSLLGEPSPLRCRLRSWWEFAETDRLRRELYGAKEGMHATPSEVAITRHTHPEHVKNVSMDSLATLSREFLREHAGDNHFDAVHHRTQFADGRVGSEPALATAADGGRLLATAIGEAYADYSVFLESDTV